MGSIICSSEHNFKIKNNTSLAYIVIWASGRMRESHFSLVALSTLPYGIETYAYTWPMRLHEIMKLTNKLFCILRCLDATTRNFDLYFKFNA
jgi:hypothetical protein